MEIKLFDSELKIMNLLWKHESVSAKELSILAKDAYGWNKNTTYTIIKKLIDKDCIERMEPGFICTAKVKHEYIAQEETHNLIERLFSGSKKSFFASFLADDSLSEAELEELQQIINSKKS